MRDRWVVGAEATRVVESAPAVRRRVSERPLVLVVDDDWATRRAVAQLISDELRADVAEAKDGEDARYALMESLPDVVLVDARPGGYRSDEDGSLAAASAPRVDRAGLDHAVDWRHHRYDRYNRNGQCAWWRHLCAACKGQALVHHALRGRRTMNVLRSPPDCRTRPTRHADRRSPSRQRGRGPTRRSRRRSRRG